MLYKCNCKYCSTDSHTGPKLSVAVFGSVQFLYDYGGRSCSSVCLSVICWTGSVSQRAAGQTGDVQGWDGSFRMSAALLRQQELNKSSREVSEQLMVFWVMLMTL